VFARRDETAFNTPLADPSLLACLQCDLVQRLPDLQPGSTARCVRCDRDLWRRREDSLGRTLALGVAAAFLYVIANSVPMLGLRVAGRHAETTVIGGAMQLWTDGEKIVSGLVLFAAVIAPGLQIVLLLTIVLLTMRGRPPRSIGTLMRYHPVTRTWSMIEVMLVGVLVALVKIAELATVIPGIALFTLFAMVVLFAAIQSSFDPREVWDRIEWADETRMPTSEDPDDAGVALAELAK
jgi:paraquat-inducible protein A